MSKDELLSELEFFAGSQSNEGDGHEAPQHKHAPNISPLEVIPPESTCLILTVELQGDQMDITTPVSCRPMTTRSQSGNLKPNPSYVNISIESIHPLLLNSRVNS